MSDNVPQPMPDDDALRRMYQTITAIRQTDERFRMLLSSGRIRSTYYSPAGQECIPAAVGSLLRPTDYSVTTYRGLADHLAKGVPMRELWAEFLGRATGTCKGKGGPMHVTHPPSGLMVTTGIVGSGLPIANGLAWASQLKGTDQVTVVSFGDGASNIGAFHEALNLAAVWKLPVLFLCSNNQYGEHTKYEWATSAAHVADRAVAYGIPGITVDGNDPVAVWRAAAPAIARARAGEGPTLLEAVTYRFWGHIFGDNMRYMPTEERKAAMDLDPVPRYREWLIAEAGFKPDDLTTIDEAVSGQIDDAVDFALNSAPPGPDELYTDIYAGAVSS